MRRKILFDTESTGSLTGFGKYGRELLSRLYENPNLEIAEFASFGTMYDNKFNHVKWLYYPNEVPPEDSRSAELNNNPDNKFGAWRFNQVVLDFKPDIVVSWRDPWMMKSMFQSPLRPFYNIAIMPTVDSVPQQPEWMEMFIDADAVFTYSDWAIPEIKKQTNNRANVIESCYCGIDLDVYKPLDKKECRKKLGLPENANIIGMVARNQIRKLYPELFKMFKIFLDKYGNTEIGKNTYLLIHSSYPDVGWEFPELLNEFGISNKVFFTTICRASGNIKAVRFQGSKLYSIYSNNLTRHHPNVAHGFTDEQMSTLYNCMDIYIQYANCEGLGVPTLEAAACGVPVSAVYYSAMADIVNKTNGIKLTPAALPRDFHMRADRADPDNLETAEKLFAFLSLDESFKQKKSRQARQGAETYFNWDITAKKWSHYFENVELVGLQGKWNMPPIYDPTLPDKAPEGLSNSDYIRWCFTYLAKRPDLAAKHIGLTFLHNLSLEGFTMSPMSREQIFDICRKMGENSIIADRIRTGQIQVPLEDYIDFAHTIKDQHG